MIWQQSVGTLVLLLALARLTWMLLHPSHRGAGFARVR